jgi:hypothetical protein
MEKVDQYRSYARQAIEAARAAATKNEKNDLLEIAETWLQLANSASTSAKSNYLTLH